MAPHSSAPAEVIFGIDPMLFAGVLFALTYLLIMTERVNRAIVSMGAAALMILGGVLTQEAAVEGVDFNTLGLLTGMMIIVAVTRHSGVFQFLAIWSAKRVKASPWGILVMLSLVTAVLSALQDKYIENSTFVNLPTWRQRPGKERFYENLARLASPLL